MSGFEHARGFTPPVDYDSILKTVPDETIKA